MDVRTSFLQYLTTSECHYKWLLPLYPFAFEKFDFSDYGMTSLEAQASGKPVIAYAGGGALESVIEGKTGIFFYEQTPEALIKAVKKFDRLEFDSKRIRKHAEKFDVEVFKRKIKNFLEEKLKEHRQKRERKSRNSDVKDSIYV